MLVDISVTSHSHSFFFMVRKHTYTVSLTVIVMLYIRPQSVLILQLVVYPLLSASPHFLLCQAPSDCHSTLCFCDCLDSTCKWYYILHVFLWLTARSIMPSEFICVTIDRGLPSGSYDWGCVCVSVYSTFSVSADGHLGCSVVLAVVGNAAVNVGMQAFLWDPVFISFLYIPRSGIVGSRSGSVFNFLRKRRAVFRSDYTVYIPTESAQGSLFSAPSPTLVTSSCW